MEKQDRYSKPVKFLDWSVDKLTHDHVAEMEKYNKYQLQDRVVHFDSLASNYEGLYLRVGYPDPKKVVEMVEKHCKNKDAKILDMACGTGLVGKYLKEAGYTNITGVDCSQKMLDEAKIKDAYKTLQPLELGNAAKFPPYLKNQFDIVTISGLVNSNFLDYELFEEITMALKQGGRTIFASRFSYLGDFWYNEVTDKMCNDKRWQFIEEETFFKYDKLVENVGRFSKTPVKVLAYKNLDPEVSTWQQQRCQTGLGADS